MSDVVGTQMDGLRIVPAGEVIAPSPQPSPLQGEGATGGEPVKTEAATITSPESTPAAIDPKAFLAQIQTVLDERDRRLQSSLDKRDRTIRQMLQERQGQVNAIGEKAKALGVPDGQIQSLQSALLNDALTEALKDTPTPQTPTQPSPAEAGEVAQAEAKAEAMAELAGLTADDPEVKMIAGYTTPAEYLAKVKAACSAKLQRTSGTPTPSPQPSPTGERSSAVSAAAVLGPGGGAANGLPPLEKVVASGGNLWREALQQAHAG